MVAATFATLRHGGDRSKKQERNSALEITAASELFNVSKDTIKDARLVHNAGRPEVVAKGKQEGRKFTFFPQLGRSGTAEERRKHPPLTDRS
jgi:hypothetical protein